MSEKRLQHQPSFVRDKLMAALEMISPNEEHLNATLFDRYIKRRTITYYVVGPIIDMGTGQSYRKTSLLLTGKSINDVLPIV